MLFLPVRLPELTERDQVPMGADGYEELELDLLRSWQLRRDSVPVHVAARQQRLIAALAVRGPSLRSFLTGLLWPEHPDARALESLRVSVHLISRQVPGLIINDGPVLSIAGRVDIDLHRLRASIRAVRESGTTGSDGLYVLRECRNAGLLPGWYEDWVVFEQDRLQQDLLRTLTVISRERLAAGDPDRAEEAAEAALQIEPLYEDAVRHLIAAELQRGNCAAALRSYERFRRRLEKDLGLAPSESVKALIAGATRSEERPRRGKLVPAADSWLGGDPTLDDS
ncbi:AfsR/SARP family transcriptional regulator [Arthrobacter sp. SAFR-044]|uniref:AfsR/SARP family transcriptional regulator n=1 Tax=Arthrobacter sp. SAFR-044 TaxID=3387278 RepID=UPI003F7BE268